MAAALVETQNSLMQALVAADPTREMRERPELDAPKLRTMVESVGRYDNGLHVFLLDHWSRSRFVRTSDSIVYDNGDATSFRLEQSLSRTGRLSAAGAIAVARTLSSGVLARLSKLGVSDAGAILVQSYAEKGREGWDYRFFAGEGSRAAAVRALRADEPVAAFELAAPAS